MSQKTAQTCDRVAAGALALSVFAAAVVFVPGGFMPAIALKGYLAIVGVLVAFSAWLIGRLIEGTFHVPKSRILLAAAALLVSVLLSVLFSRTPGYSFFGDSFEQSTGAFLIVACLSLFLASVLFSDRRRLRSFIQSFLGIYFLIALFELVHLFFPVQTAFGVFASPTDTLLGSWGDFSAFSGAALVMLVFGLEFLPPRSRRARILIYIGAILALFFVIVTNVLLTWILVGIAGLFILIYKLVSSRFMEQRRLPGYAFTVVLISLLFLFANNLIGGALAYKLNASILRISPSISATLHVAGSSLHAHPIFGAGPNQFSNEWLMRRPVGVNTTALWNTPFQSGSSFALSVATVTGIIGLLAWILLLATLGYESLRNAFKPSGETGGADATIFGVLLCSLYFMCVVFFSAPGIPSVLTAFIFTGMLLAVFVGTARIPVRNISFLGDQRTGFFSILLIVFFLLSSAAFAYGATEYFAATVYYRKAIRAASAGDFAKADVRLSQALSLREAPLFERTRVAVAEQELNQLVSTATSDSVTDAFRASLQNIISTANTAARAAVAADPADPQNYIALGDFMSLASSLKIKDAFDVAHDAYQQVITLAPHYPVPYLGLSKLYFNSGDTKSAREYAQKAIAEKSNYTAAFFMMAQIESADGNSAAAEKRLEDATVIDQNNPDTYFELGLLRYQNGDYTGAVSAFRTTVSIDSNYLNAWYFLAESDHKTGNDPEARTILNALAKRLPDNADVRAALDMLYAPVAPAVPEKSKTTTKAKKLPVSDSESTPAQP